MEEEGTSIALSTEGARESACVHLSPNTKRRPQVFTPARRSLAAIPILFTVSSIRRNDRPCLLMIGKLQRNATKRANRPREGEMCGIKASAVGGRASSIYSSHLLFPSLCISSCSLLCPPWQPPSPTTPRATGMQPSVSILSSGCDHE